MCKLRTVTASNNVDHSIIACSRHIYVGVVPRAHPVRGEPHIQRNATREVATVKPAESSLLQATTTCHYYLASLYYYTGDISIV